MLRILTVLFCLIAASIASSTAFASELTWETTKLSSKPKLGEKEASFTFKFKNTSTRDVKISKLLSSCGCTTADLESKTIPSQETAELTAIMKLKGITGLKSSTIKVYLNDSSSPSYTLSIKVDVPNPIQVTPVFLNWKKNEQRSSKDISIKIHQDFKAKLSKVEVQNKDFTHKVIDQEDGSKTLQLTPPTTEQLKTGRTKAILHFTDSKGKVSKKNIYLFIY